MKTFKRIMLALVVMLSLALVACCPKDSDSAKTKMEEAGYAVVVDSTVQPGVLKLAGIKGVTAVVTCIKESEALNAYYFESSSAAKDAMAKLEERAKNEENNKSGLVRSGSCIYFGTEGAVKDFK